jgi:hypothetical protein
MNIVKATRSYEQWLSGRLRLISADLARKHRSMAECPFAFFRATFYRWAQLWTELCAPLAHAPKVIGVGDLHVENFGTWRDSEGRLVWGINDFDEAAFMPYTMDLVRLATSARFAIRAGHLHIKATRACASILKGYRKGINSGGCPVVLGEHHHWLRELAVSNLRDPSLFWAKLTALPDWKKRVPKSAIIALERAMPVSKYRLVHRMAGIGSLGRERYAAIADFQGGKIAREAKALTASAYNWATGAEEANGILYQKILDHAIRCDDPFVRLRGRWIVRRLAPDCSRIELSLLPKRRNELRLLYEMGWETANVHLGSPKTVKAIRKDLKRRPARWLEEASAAMATATKKDWKEWVDDGSS